MKKCKMHAKRKIWAFLAVVVVIGIACLTSCNSALKTAKMNEKAEAKTQAVQKEDFILDIPLSEELQEELYEASEEFGVDYYIMVALIDKESKFENVVSDNGDSYGYCQIQPKWWYGLMVEIGATDLTLAEDNFRVGCAIISRLTEKHKSVEGALVEYNQGSYNGSSTSYSREIIENAKRYKA